MDLVDRDDLKFHPLSLLFHKLLQAEEIYLNRLAKRIIYYITLMIPFSPMVDFLRQAAIDPEVFAIKLTIYRTSGDSPIVKALMDAAQNGKQVTAMVELKARFDEEANVQWSRKMEEVGVHVVYGLAGLKTHCKCCLVVRREGKKLKRYAHLGTGNYNPANRNCTDYSLFTAKAAFTSDMANLFNTLTGYTRKPVFKKLLVAPFNLHESMMQKIQHESMMAKRGKETRIIIKVNSLIDPQIIQLLYEASQAGVKGFNLCEGFADLFREKGPSETSR